MPAETESATTQVPAVLAPPSLGEITDGRSVAEKMEAWKPALGAMEAQAIEAARASRDPIQFPPLPIHKRLWYRMLRWVNKKVNKLEYKLRRRVLWTMPHVIVVDPTNQCQLRCPLCATGTFKSNHKRGKLQLEFFQKLWDVLGRYAYQLHLYNWGEPLLNDQLCDIISYAKRYPVKVFFSSNLNLLTEEMAEKLVKSGCDEVTCAVDGMSQESYEQYRVGGDWQKMIDNIQLLERKKKELASKTPKIIFRFMVMRHNAQELKQAKEMAALFGVSFRKKTVRIDMADFGEGSIWDKFEKYKNWLPEDADNNRYKKHPERLQEVDPCQDLWMRTFISWDGAVSPCCNVFNTRDYFSPNFEFDFKSRIWNGPKYTAARGVFRGETPEKGNFVVCDGCVKSGNNIWVS